MAVPSFAADLKAAEHSLLMGQVDEALRLLRQATAANPRDGAAHLLLCRAFYAEDHADEAVNSCEAALNNGLANSSQAQDWMGRAYGKKADGAGPFAGLSLARKVKNAFERAVELDPNNAEAADDLSEYYVNAPAIVGGGLDKASDLSARIQTRLSQASHRIAALVAEKKKDYAAAETQFRVAAAVAGHADAWFDLGHFYARRKQFDQSLAAFHHALQVDTARDATLVDIASVLIENHREPQLAERSLREYLASSARSDAAPTFRAHYQLGQLLAANGNKPAAKLEYQAALALASNYAPARKALAQ